MAFDPLLESVNVLSVLATLALVILTTKPCRASGVPYMVGIPAGFGLMMVAFAAQTIMPLLIQGSSMLASPVEAVWLLTQTYGVLFLAFVYARRTRLRLLGESTSADLFLAALVTVAFLGVVILARAYGMVDAAPLLGEFLLRWVIVAASIYLVYETLRNWWLTQKASQGIVTIGFAFFVIEQLGFVLALANFGSVANFIAYEGRILGLFVLNAILIVRIKKDDPVAVMKRLGLVAPVHARAPEMRVK
jgi:hypothetical protein